MKSFFIIVSFFVLSSCDNLNVKKTSSEAILNEELQTFNWDDVDVYPSFSVCDDLSSKTEQQACFQNTLVGGITDYLTKENLIVTQDINDTVLLSFRVDRLGKLTVLQVDLDSITEGEIPNIKRLINQSLDTLPEVYPAIKRGQQVTTEFNLPIIINVR